jgi:hypothetical protein
MWRVSCLVVSSANVASPQLVYETSSTETGESTPTVVNGQIIDSYRSWNFAVFHLVIPQHATEELAVKYTVDLVPPSGSDKVGVRRLLEHAFFIPAAGVMPNALVYSCNDTQTDTDREKLADYSNTWRHAHNVAAKEGHIHVMLGLGDQVYADSVLRLPCIRDWSLSGDIGAPFSAATAEVVSDEYFRIYMMRYSEAGTGVFSGCEHP